MTTASFHPLKPEAWELLLQFLLPHSPNNPTESISKSALDAVRCRPPLPQLRPPLALYKYHTDFLGVREPSQARFFPSPPAYCCDCFPSSYQGKNQEEPNYNQQQHWKQKLIPSPVSYGQLNSLILRQCLDGRGWPWTWCLSQGDIELLIFLSPLLTC